MAATYEPIASTTLGSAAGSITFSSIPGTYTDLLLVGKIVRGNTSNGVLTGQVNGETSGTNYSSTWLTGSGSAAASGRDSNTSRWIWSAVNSPSDTPGVLIAHFLSYANTNVYKTVLARFDVASGTYPGVNQAVSLWRSTAAITSVTVSNVAGSSLGAGTVISLYGLAAA